MVLMHYVDIKGEGEECLEASSEQVIINGPEMQISFCLNAAAAAALKIISSRTNLECCLTVPPDSGHYY